MSRILIVDDDKNICTLQDLTCAGWPQCYFAHDGRGCHRNISGREPDLWSLDVMLPVMDGWDILQTIRQESRVPVIMLTAVDACEDKVTGLDLGADDYVVKPFDPGVAAGSVKPAKQVPPHKDNVAEVLTAGNSWSTA